MKVAFEGMDGVGKSSTAEEVAKRTGFIHETQRMINIMGIDDKTFSKLVKTVRNSTNEKLGFIFYTLRCMLDNESDKDTIVERTMMSTYYFEHQKVSLGEFDYAMQLDVIPDITFLLYASSEERYKRIYKRNPSDSDLQSEEALTDGYPIMLDFAKRYDIPYIGIDTEKYTHEEIVDICSDIIKKLKEMNPDQRKGYIEEMNREFGFEQKYKPQERKLIYEVRHNNNWNGSKQCILCI